MIGGVADIAADMKISNSSLVLFRSDMALAPTSRNWLLRKMGKSSLEFHHLQRQNFYYFIQINFGFIPFKLENKREEKKENKLPMAIQVQSKLLAKLPAPRNSDFVPLTE